MEKIRQTGFLKLNFEIIQIIHFLVFAKHFCKPWMKLNIFLENFQKLGPLGCEGWVVIPQNVKKAKILHPSVHRAKDLQRPGGAKPGGHLCGPPEGPQWFQPGVSCRGRLSRQPSQEFCHLFNPACNILKLQIWGGGWGGGMWRCGSNIYFCVVVFYRGASKTRNLSL
jgi:hypothetical protein